MKLKLILAILIQFVLFRVLNGQTLVPITQINKSTEKLTSIRNIYLNSKNKNTFIDNIITLKSNFSEKPKGTKLSYLGDMIAARKNYKTSRNTLFTSLRSGTISNEEFDLQLDTLQQLKEQYDVDAFNLYIRSKRVHIIPCRSTASTEAYFNSGKDKSIEALRNSYFKYNPGVGGAIVSELIAGYAGPFRISFAALLSKSIDVKLDTSISKLNSEQTDSLINAIDSINTLNSSINALFSGGGNAMLNFALPLIDITSYDKKFKLSLYFYDRLSFKVPALGTEETELDFVNDASLLLSIIGNIKPEKSNSIFSGFFDAKISMLNGSNQFYESLGITKTNDKGEIKADRKALFYSELSAGFTLDNFRFYVNKQFFISNDKNVKSVRDNLAAASVGVQVLLKEVK